MKPHLHPTSARRTVQIGRSTIQGTADEILDHIMRGRPAEDRVPMSHWILRNLLGSSRRNFMFAKGATHV